MFKRGYVCDLECYFNRVDIITYEQKENRVELIRDLVLLYINKSTYVDGYTQFEYVFYK